MLTQRKPWKIQILNYNVFLISSKLVGFRCPSRDLPLNKNWNTVSLVNVCSVLKLLFLHELMWQTLLLVCSWSPTVPKTLQDTWDWGWKAPPPPITVSSYFQVYLVAQLFWTSGQFLNFKFASSCWWWCFGKANKCLSFHGSSAGKESACNAGDLSSIPELGRYPGEGSSYLLKYSDL